jgi:hypothetical protein
MDIGFGYIFGLAGKLVGKVKSLLNRNGDSGENPKQA